jgi:hypothetical protein
MKSDILKRAMFAMPLSKDARNSGIMSGFDEEDMEPPEEETMPSMARTPQNPEILMNNLRGDMRSVDARRNELALMVGEEAADETPPEVLAMLQMQLGQQQGIGALPQAAAMAPPPMPGAAPMGAPSAPPQGGMPPAPPAPPQGGMPPGMQSAGPLAQGGAEQAPQGFADGGMVAPPTPDGMPPMYAQAGALVNAGTRAAQFAQSLGARAAPYLQDFNAMLGRQTMPPTMTQPFLENVRGPMGRYTAQQINRGGDLIYPTFTQGVSQQAAQFLQNNPRIAGAVRPVAAGLTAAAAPLMSTLGLGESTSMSPEQQAAYDRDKAALDYIDSPENTAKERLRAMKPSFNSIRQPKGPLRLGTNVMTTENEPQGTDRLGDFITQQLADQAAANEVDNRQLAISDVAKAAAVTTEKEKPTVFASRLSRIKEAREGYAPLFDELLAGDGEDAKTNALLMLSEAGFKFANTAAATPAMAFAEAASGLPRGFAALLAQQKDRKLKVDTAVLSKAIDDVDLQDKYAQAMQLEMIKGDARLKSEFLKGDQAVILELAKQGGTILEDAGYGGRYEKTPKGSFIKFSMEPKDPSVTSMIGSDFTLRPTDNPYVRNLGKASTTVVTDKEQRLKLGARLRELDNDLQVIQQMKGVVQNAYSPGAWLSDKVNNLLVPISFGFFKPNFDTADAALRLKSFYTNISKPTGNDGRFSTQQQDWEMKNLKPISEPTGFLEDQELAANAMNSLQTIKVNERQTIATQLGVVSDNLVMDTPATGTVNNPFKYTDNPEDQQIMSTFLVSAVAKKAPSTATFYVQMPGTTKPQAYTAAQLIQTLGAKQ